MVPRELGKRAGVCPLLRLSHGLSHDTRGVAELLPRNDESTAMTWLYPEILACKQSLTGS